MTAANGDRITVQRVTSTVAGEYREWTVTVRKSSPAGVGDPLNTQTDGAHELLPVDVREQLARWLDTPPRWARGGWTGPRPDGAPLLVGRDFQVGDRKPLFPIAEPEPAAPYAGRTGPRRTRPPEAPVRLWNRDYTDKLDVIGRAAGGGLDGVQRIRIRDDHADPVRQWLRDRITDDEHVFVIWADRPWSFVGYGSGGGSGPLSLDLLPLPKPPRVDQVLEREPLNIAEMRAGAEAMRARSPKTLCPGCTNPAEHGHYPWCPHATDANLYREPREPAPEPDVDEVLPMPGGPNDRLAQAARPTLCVQRRRPNGLPCLRAAGHTGQHRDYTGTTWTTPSPYADLYARLPYLHDATAEEDQ